MSFSSSLYPRADKQALLDTYLGKPINAIPTPACLISSAIFKANCIAMLETASRLDVSFRAHIKSHKTLEGIKLQIDPSGIGRTGSIVVSTIMEAFSVLPLVKTGLISDLLYGLPVVTSRIPELRELSRLVSLKVMVDSIAQVDALLTNDVTSVWAVFVKIDCGTSRAGLTVSSTEMQDLIRHILKSERITLFGFYCHAGHSYSTTTMPDAKDLLKSEITHGLAAAEFANSIVKNRYTVSFGATPTAHSGQSTTTDELRDWVGSANVNLELHAGCYPLNDLQQLCTTMIDESAIAIRVLAEVVSIYQDRKEILINAGTVALAKEQSSIPGSGLVRIDGDHNVWTVVRTSQEHGILAADRSLTAVEHGSKVLITPQHACITASAYPWFFVVDKLDFDGVVTDIWPRFNGW